MTDIESFYKEWELPLRKLCAKRLRRSYDDPNVKSLAAGAWYKAILKWDQCKATTARGRYHWLCTIALRYKEPGTRTKVYKNTLHNSQLPEEIVPTEGIYGLQPDLDHWVLSDLNEAQSDLLHRLASGESYSSIAKALGIKLSTLYNRKHYLKQKFKDFLD